MTHYNFGNVQKCFSKKQRNVNLKKGNSHKKRASLFQRRLLISDQHFFFGILQHEIKLIMAVNLHRCFQCTKKG